MLDVTCLLCKEGCKEKLVCRIIKEPLNKGGDSHSRQEVNGRLDYCKVLIDSLVEEDRLLRQRCTSCPKSLRETRGEAGALSFKETLGHIAFWDSFTVDFFTTKLDKTAYKPSPPVDFELQSHNALEAVKSLPFGEVLARYLESTGAMIEFLRENWKELSQREQEDFWVPLKHRRHHRINLFKSLDNLQDGGSSESGSKGSGSKLREMTCGT